MKQDIYKAALDYATAKTGFKRDTSKEVDASNYTAHHADCAVDFIIGAKWQAEQSPWISVEDLLPDNGNNVFCTNTQSKIVGVAFYENMHWHEAYGMGVIKDVTHWMPIPDVEI